MHENCGISHTKSKDLLCNKIQVHNKPRYFINVLKGTYGITKTCHL